MRLPWWLSGWRLATLCLAVVVVAGLAAGGVVWGRRLADQAADRDARVAVLPFRTPGGDPGTRAMAAGLADEITGFLSNNQMLTVSADGAGGNAPAPDAALLLEGSIKREGDMLNVHARLIDGASRAVLWSDSFSGKAADPSSLQTAVAAKVTDMLNFALIAKRNAHAGVDATVAGDYIEANMDIAFGYPDGGVKARAPLLRVIQRAPDFSHGHSLLAVVDSELSHTGPPEQLEPMQQEAREQSRIALRLDPNNGEAWLARVRLAKSPMDWQDRESAVANGLAVEPGNPYLNNNYAYGRANVGRTREAVTWIRKGLALNPLHPGANYRAALHLADTGRYDDARQAMDTLARDWPKAWTDEARISLVSNYGPADEARVLLNRSLAHPYPGEAAWLKLWDQYLRALDGGAAQKAAAARDIRTAALSSQLLRVDALLMLNRLGRLDDAFAEAGRDPVDCADHSTYVLFSPLTAPMRADPRFWPLAKTLGLTRYWLQTGNWPDVCVDGALADCRAKAAAVEK